MKNISQHDFNLYFSYLTEVVEHLFTYLRAICIPLYGNCLLVSFAHFPDGLSFAFLRTLLGELGLVL